MDNAGNARVNRPAPRAPTRPPLSATIPPATTTMPPATTPIPPATTTGVTIPPASPTSAPAAGDFAARVDEQMRAVRAVAALLVERGVIRPEDLPR
jgi:hypothetical protein